MPQITLEYTANIVRPASWEQVFNGIHQLIHQITGVHIENCKSRAVSQENFYIGGGGKTLAFIHLEVALLSGKPDEVKQKLGNELLEFLLGEFEKLNVAEKLQVTVELRDIQRLSYFKFPSGTLSQA